MKTLTKKDLTGGVMNFGGIQKLLSNLIEENDPSNNELITFYKRKLSEAIDKFYSKKRIF